MKIKVGTRGSRLALAQTEYVCQKLRERYPLHEFEIMTVKTKGDVILDKPLHQIGGKGLFVREIEEMILRDEIQMGVHSMKDMPALPAAGLTFSRPWKREDARDVLILREKRSLEELPEAAVIATGSKRRAHQLKKLRPDLEIVGIRGNVDTRLRKMEELKLDGLVLAGAGLVRLGMEDRITAWFSEDQMIPAPAQGVLALELRQDNTELLAMLDACSDPETEFTAAAERLFLEQIGGDCHMPIGACCKKKQGGTYELSAVFGRGEDERLYYARVLGEYPEKMAKEAACLIRRQAAGIVYLVGGGPGDEELITVKGLRLIREADCIIYDRLASPELLAYARKDCEKIYVGKADRRHTMRQEDISRLLVKKALQYRKVVRLKGGDPYVFGRGGEEALTLREAAVGFEVVPGISSSMAGPAYAGIPLTMRQMASGFHVVTAHSHRDELADIDFEAMGRSGDTCVFLMGLSKVQEIARRLLSAGKPQSTPAAVISCATTSRQRTLVSDLAHIAGLAEQEKPVSPALIVVGDVVSCRESLNFFEEKPFFGKQFLVPVTGEGSSPLAKELRRAGAMAEELVIGRIETVERTLTREELKTVDWLIFTSKNGVSGFFENLKKSGLDARSLSKARIAAIGEQTGRCLAQYGLTADLVPEEFHSGALCQEMEKILRKKKSEKDQEGIPCVGEEKACWKVWYCKAEKTDNEIEKRLSGLCRFINVPVYRNVEPEFIAVDPEKWAEYDGVFFTSASAVRRVFKALRQPEEKAARTDGQSGADKRPVIFSIGPKCSAQLRELGITDYMEAARAEYGEMAAAAEKIWRDS